MKKNRVRIPKSCSVCRVKKIKCDRKTPFCGSCAENKTSNLCKYDQTAWLNEGPPESPSSANLKKEILKLRSRISTLEAKIKKQLLSSDSRLSLSTTSTLPLPKRNYQENGELLTNNLMLCENENTVNVTIKHLKLLYFGPSSNMYLLLNDKYSRELFASYVDDQLEKFKLKSTSLEIQDDRLFNEDIANYCNRPMESVIGDSPELPPLKIVNALVQRFFKVCYKFAPIFDEKVFINEICHMFKNKQRISKEDLVFKKSTVAILLIMLRFAYLTLPLKAYHNNALQGSESNFVREVLECNVDISSSYIEYSKQLIINSTCLEKIDFRKIQAILLLRVYYQHSPENDNIAVESNILLDIAVPMARFFGLHKDPTSIKLLDLHNNDIHLWRKVWAMFLYFDSLQASDFGVPLLINEEEIDTHPPFADDSEGEKLWLPNEEIKLERFFKLNCVTSRVIRKAVLLLQSKLGVKLFEVDELISEFEDILNNKMRNFDELYSNELLNDQIDNYLELMLRMVMLRKLFSLTYLCYMSSNKDGKKYLHVAIETGLAIIIVGYHFARDPTIATSLESEIIVSPLIWNPVKIVLPLVCGLLIGSLKEEVSFTEAVHNFILNDSSSSLMWLQVYQGNEKNAVLSIILKLEEYQLLTTQLSVRYFDCYHICITLKIFLNYLQNNFTTIMQSQLQSMTKPKDLENRDVSKFGINPTVIDDFWKKEINFEAAFDEFLSSLNYNTDPFLNDLLSQ